MNTIFFKEQMIRYDFKCNIIRKIMCYSVDDKN